MSHYRTIRLMDMLWNAYTHITECRTIWIPIYHPFSNVHIAVYMYSLLLYSIGVAVISKGVRRWGGVAR